MSIVRNRITKCRIQASSSRTGTERKGAAMIEMALVLPPLILLTLGIIEFGSIFFIHNNMLFAARAAVRPYAIGEVNSSEAAQIANDKLAPFTNVNFTVTVSPSASTNRERWVQISVPMSEAALVDPLGLVSSGTPLTVKVYMRQEN